MFRGAGNSGKGRPMSISTGSLGSSLPTEGSSNRGVGEPGNVAGVIGVIDPLSHSLIVQQVYLSFWYLVLAYRHFDWYLLDIPNLFTGIRPSQYNERLI